MIGDRSTKGMTVEDAANLIRGEAGTKVKIKFLRDSKPFELTITRARVEVPSVESSVKQEEGQRVGYIRLNQFTTHSQEEMQLTVKSLIGKGVDSFVLDLRGNPGGSLKACIDIARMWVNEGPIVKTVDRDNSNEVYEANRSALTDLPLVVLVDKGSASSSEILSGAVKDNKRALLVGTQTFGKALVQSLHSLSDGSGIAVTIAHYYTPDGTDISKKGVKPDIELALTEDQQKFLATNQDAIATVKGDPQYAKAVQLLRERFGILARPTRSNSAAVPLRW
jgi:carboxyl-terminal processing protease